MDKVGAYERVNHRITYRAANLRLRSRANEFYSFLTAEHDEISEIPR